MSEFETPFLKVADTWELPEDLFLKWWACLDPLDRDAFRYLYHGDELLARFVCAIDYLAMQKCKGDKESLIQLAYHIACKPFPEVAVALDDPGLKNRSARAWREDCVQDLLGRVSNRNASRENAEIKSLLAKRIKKELENLDDLEPKDRAALIGAATKYVSVIDKETESISSERLKRGISKGREALKGAEEKELSGRELAVHAKMVLAKMTPQDLIEVLPAEVKDALAQH